MIKVTALTFYHTNISVDIEDLPNTCPLCNRSIKPDSHFGFWHNEEEGMELILRCPSQYCGHVFIAYYDRMEYDDYGNKIYSHSHCLPSNPKRSEFSENIFSFSPAFIEIYNDAIAAEGYGLDNIVGIGLRKALEFLIKDYLLYTKPEHQEQILKKMLGPCIKEYIANPNIKNMAERAVWLGNDHTHYVKKWEDKDIKDLKILIDLTLHWIEMEMLTAKYENEM